MKSPLLRQYAIISAAIIIMLGIELFVPWPWSIMGGLVMIFMVPIIFKYTVIPTLGTKFQLQCLSCGTVSKARTCPKCGQNSFKSI